MNRIKGHQAPKSNKLKETGFEVFVQLFESKILTPFYTMAIRDGGVFNGFTLFRVRFEVYHIRIQRYKLCNLDYFLTVLF